MKFTHEEMDALFRDAKGFRGLFVPLVSALIFWLEFPKVLLMVSGAVVLKRYEFGMAVEVVKANASRISCDLGVAKSTAYSGQNIVACICYLQKNVVRVVVGNLNPIGGFRVLQQLSPP